MVTSHGLPSSLAAGEADPVRECFEHGDGQGEEPEYIRAEEDFESSGL